MQRKSYVLTSLCALACACSKPANDTRIYVVVASDLAVPEQLDSIAVEVKGPTGSTYASTRPLTAGGEAGKTALPLVVALVPADNKALALEVTATGFLAGNPLLSQSARRHPSRAIDKFTWRRAVTRSELRARTPDGRRT